MGDPVSLALMAQAGGAVFSGVQAFGAAAGEKKRAEINSYIGRTRAGQTDTTAREGLADELATIRNTLAAAGQQPGVGTLTVLNEVSRIRNRDRRIEVGNRFAEAADWRQQAKNISPIGAFASKAGGAVKPLFSLSEYMRSR